MTDTYNKKEREKKKEQRRKEKQSKKEARKETGGSGGWESMMAYVDENGMLVDTPQDPSQRVEIDAENIEIGVPKRVEGEEDATLVGVVNFFDESKGYGFIKTSDDESFFVHINNVSGTITKGNRVKFEKEKGPKGWTAVKVTLDK